MPPKFLDRKAQLSHRRQEYGNKCECDMISVCEINLISEQGCLT